MKKIPIKPIEGCHNTAKLSLAKRVAWSFICPKTWDSLEDTAAPKVRHCRACGQDVHLIEDAFDFSFGADGRKCIAMADGTSMIVGSRRYRP